MPESMTGLPTDPLSYVDAAVGTAAEAQLAWGCLDTRARSHHLKAIRRSVAAVGEEVAHLICADTGKPMLDALLEVTVGVTMLDWAARHAERALRPTRASTVPVIAKRAWVEYSPLGVVGIITPFNYPVGILMQSLPWALAAGNTVVFKPSELTPSHADAIAAAINSAGADLVQVVTGDGSVGDAIVRAPGIDAVVFTGSVEIGRRIAATCGELLKPCVMELGGKDAMIVCSDADVRRAARAAAGSGFSNAGQTCMAPERIIVDEAIHDDFVGELVRVAEAMRPAEHFGPVMTERQIELVEERLEKAVAAGARIVTGGYRIQKVGERYFSPTVVLDVPNNSDLLRLESFVPVVSVLRSTSDDNAVAMANDTEFGLSASVFSSDRRRAQRVASRMRTGGVVIGDALFGAGIAGLPFGGEGVSGVGRLQGRQGFHTLSRKRSVVANRFPHPPFTSMLMTGRRPSDKVMTSTLRMFARGARR